MNPASRIQEIGIGLLDSSKPDTSRWGPREVEQAIAFYGQNKISFLELLQKDGGRRFQGRGLFEEALHQAAAAERRKYQDWRDSFIKIKQEWDGLGIAYIFLKSSGRFPHLSDNLDVMVRSSDFRRAAESLRSLGYTDLRNIQEPHKRFYRRLGSDGEWAPIHLHERVCWGFPFEDNAHLWNHALTSADDEIVRYPCPEDIVLVHTAHSFLEDHEIKLSEFLTLRACLQDRMLDWPYVIRTARDMNWLHALWAGFVMIEGLHLRLFEYPLFPAEISDEAKSYVSRRRWIRTVLDRSLSSRPLLMPFRIPHLWTRVHSSWRVLQDRSLGNRRQRSALVFSHLLDGFIHRKLRLSTHPRMFIALCGLDGSGKTRHGQALQQAFRTCGIKARLVWSRAGSLPLTRVLLRVLRAAKLDYQKKSPVDRKTAQAGRFSQKKWALALWSAVNGLDIALFNLVKVTIPLAIGRVVIADRFLYDSFVDLESLRATPNFRRPLYRLLKRLTPAPDFLFFLDIQPDGILERGVAEDKQSLQKKSLLYQETVKQAGAVVINTHRPFHQVEGEIIRNSLAAFYQKYPEKYDGYRLVSLRY